MDDEALSAAEAELGSLKPLRLSPGLKRRLVAASTGLPTRGDWVLAACVEAGALAAGVIAGLVVWNLATGTPLADASTMAMQRPTAAEVERWIAVK